ncbi:MAG: hypothetical protein QXH24_07385 [Candidatus Bathyarchaeia archaeon]
MRKGGSTKCNKIDLEKMKKLEENVLEDFRILVNNLIPVNPDQAKWICSEIERLSKDYPYLRNELIYKDFRHDKP